MKKLCVHTNYYGICKKGVKHVGKWCCILQILVYR